MIRWKLAWAAQHCKITIIPLTFRWLKSRHKVTYVIYTRIRISLWSRSEIFFPISPLQKPISPIQSLEKKVMQARCHRVGRPQQVSDRRTPARISASGFKLPSQYIWIPHTASLRWQKPTAWSHCDAWDWARDWARRWCSCSPSAAWTAKSIAEVNPLFVSLAIHRKLDDLLFWT